MNDWLNYIGPILLSAVFALLINSAFNFIYHRKLWVHDAKILFYQLFLFFVIILSANLKLVVNNSLSKLVIFVSIILVGTTVISLGRKSFYPYAKPSKTNKLITSGPFKIVRHPFYLALIIFCMAIVITKPLLVVFLLALIFILDAKANMEEEHLGKMYDRYKDYQKNTKKLIPFIY